MSLQKINCRMGLYNDALHHLVASVLSDLSSCGPNVIVI